MKNVAVTFQDSPKSNNSIVGPELLQMYRRRLRSPPSAELAGRHRYRRAPQIGTCHTAFKPLWVTLTDRSARQTWGSTSGSPWTPWVGEMKVKITHCCCRTHKNKIFTNCYEACHQHHHLTYAFLKKTTITRHFYIIKMIVHCYMRQMWSALWTICKLEINFKSVFKHFTFFMSKLIPEKPFQLLIGAPCFFHLHFL